MKLKLFIGVVLVLGLAASGAWADLLTTPGLTITVGDKTFSNFTCSIATFDEVAYPSDCSTISVAASTDTSGNLGILFTGSFGALYTATYGPGSVDIDIDYTVTAPSPLITDLHMVFNGAITGNGFAHVTEQVNAGKAVVGQIAVGNPLPGSETGVVLVGGPYTTLNVSKDIELLAPTPGDSATISSIGQYFSQTVPEPASILLFGTLLLGCGSLLRKRA